MSLVAAGGVGIGSLADPSTSGSLLNAVNWIQGTLLGSVAVVVATLAVAGIGFMMLTGRVDIRRGMTVLVGSFLLLGSPVIAGAIQSLWVGSPGEEPVAIVESPPVPPPLPPAAPPANADPYAGASVPVR